MKYVLSKTNSVICLMKVTKFDEFVKSQKAPVIVIPVKTGIQENQSRRDNAIWQ